jgi:hypothetical protein
MKKTVLFIAIALCSLTVEAQNSSNIAVAVVVPQQVDHLNDSQTTRLGKKMLDLTVKSGLSATERNTGVIVFPVFSIEKEEVVEGGMQNIVVVSADISFVVKQLETEVVFTTFNRQVRGSGSNRQRAIDDAISKISVKDKDFEAFADRAREKILAYYNNNCNNLLLQAESCAKRNDYEKALALIAAIPDVASCYPQALRTAEKFYGAYQAQRCNEVLVRSQSLYAAHKYVDALYELYDLNVFTSDCTREAKSLMNTIESKLSADEQRAWNYAVQQNNNRTALAEKRLETIQAIAVAYYEREINNNYHFIY